MAIIRFFKLAAASILDFRNFKLFNRRNDQDGRTLSACQILSQSVNVRPRYSDSTIFFKTAAAAISDFEFHISNGLNGKEGRTGGRLHLGFSKFQII